MSEATHLGLVLAVPKKWTGEPTETAEEAVTGPPEEAETTSMIENNEDRSLEEEAKELNWIGREARHPAEFPTGTRTLQTKCKK